jgi:carbamoyl-phosphate synthase large subunit
MKSVGETMAIGRTFKESLQKGLRSLEIDRDGFGADGKDDFSGDIELLRKQLKQPTPDRLFQIKAALESGITVGEVADLTKIDPWFLHNLSEIVSFENTLREAVQ